MAPRNRILGAIESVITSSFSCLLASSSPLASACLLTS
jgi:hypothetical protein